MALGEQARRGERAQLRQLRWASLIEGTTLVTLVGLAMPLKHLFGYPQVSAVLGPVHGLAFLAYLWVVFATVAGGDWRRTEVTRLILAAFVPFGAFFNSALLRRKEARLAAAA